YIFFFTLFRVVTFLRSLRIIILVRVFRLASQKKELEKVTRRMVSENKRRYQKDGFDLDLTYVTDRVIAMSFPSSGRQALYRNPIREVARFLDTKHEDHYRVYNLCSEKGYDPKFFHYRVERVFIDDHNVPSLEDMLKYTAGVREWMAADPNNIIAIHCKGGKGRTGTLVCTWLIDSDQFESAQDSLDYFGERRTDKSRSSKFQGVETPSQSRYVGYYEVMKTKFNRQLPPEQSLKIKSIRIHSITGLIEYLSTIITSTPQQGLPKGYEDCPFYFWFNTSFIDNNRYVNHRGKYLKIFPLEYLRKVLLI
uniref:Transmembrane phosphatase with tensin homology n=1 Tax=Hucho hucho TaxID=62062 RepID=A0A4W5LTZ1_9TELE